MCRFLNSSQVVKKDKCYPGALTCVGESYSMLREPTKARVEYGNAVTICNTSDVTTFLGLSGLLLDQGSGVKSSDDSEVDNFGHLSESARRRMSEDYNYLFGVVGPHEKYYIEHLSQLSTTDAAHSSLHVQFLLNYVRVLLNSAAVSLECFAANEVDSDGDSLVLNADSGGIVRDAGSSSGDRDLGSRSIGDSQAVSRGGSIGVTVTVPLSSISTASAAHCSLSTAKAVFFLKLMTLALPSHQEISDLLHSIYTGLGQHTEALSLAKRFMSTSPTYYLGHYLMGRSLLELGRLKQAESALEVAVMLNTNKQASSSKFLIKSKFLLAVAYSDQGMHSSAVPLLRNVVSSVESGMFSGHEDVFLRTFSGGRVTLLMGRYSMERSAYCALGEAQLHVKDYLSAYVALLKCTGSFISSSALMDESYGAGKVGEGTLEMSSKQLRLVSEKWMQLSQVQHALGFEEEAAKSMENSRVKDVKISTEGNRGDSGKSAPDSPTRHSEVSVSPSIADEEVESAALIGEDGNTDIGSNNSTAADLGLYTWNQSTAHSDIGQVEVESHSDLPISIKGQKGPVSVSVIEEKNALKDIISSSTESNPLMKNIYPKNVLSEKVPSVSGIAKVLMSDDSVVTSANKDVMEVINAIKEEVGGKGAMAGTTAKDTVIAGYPVKAVGHVDSSIEVQDPPSKPHTQSGADSGVHTETEIVTTDPPKDCTNSTNSTDSSYDLNSIAVTESQGAAQVEEMPLDLEFAAESERRADASNEFNATYDDSAINVSQISAPTSQEVRADIGRQEGEEGGAGREDANEDKHNLAAKISAEVLSDISIPISNSTVLLEVDQEEIITLKEISTDRNGSAVSNNSTASEVVIESDSVKGTIPQSLLYLNHESGDKASQSTDESSGGGGVDVGVDRKAEREKEREREKEKDGTEDGSGEAVTVTADDSAATLDTSTMRASHENVLEAVTESASLANNTDATASPEPSASTPLSSPVTVPIPDTVPVPIPVTDTVPIPVTVTVPIPATVPVPIPVTDTVPIPVPVTVPTPVPVTVPTLVPVTVPATVPPISQKAPPPPPSPANIRVATQYMTIAKAYTGRGDFELALKQLSKAEKKAENYPEVYFMRAKVYEAMGQVLHTAHCCCCFNDLSAAYCLPYPYVLKVQCNAISAFSTIIPRHSDFLSHFPFLGSHHIHFVNEASDNLPF